MSIRNERISEQLRNEISVILRDSVTDPRIGMLSIIRIKLSRDLSHAQVFWSPVGAADDADMGEMEEGLASAAPYVRKLVAERLNLRKTPEFDFRHDRSIEEGDRTLTLLKQLEISPEAGADESSADSQTAEAAGEDEDGAAS